MCTSANCGISPWALYLQLGHSERMGSATICCILFNCCVAGRFYLNRTFFPFYLSDDSANFCFTTRASYDIRITSFSAVVSCVSSIMGKTRVNYVAAIWRSSSCQLIFNQNTVWIYVQVDHCCKFIKTWKLPRAVNTECCRSRNWKFWFQELPDYINSRCLAQSVNTFRGACFQTGAQMMQNVQLRSIGLPLCFWRFPRIFLTALCFFVFFVVVSSYHPPECVCICSFHFKPDHRLDWPKIWLKTKTRGFKRKLVTEAIAEGAPNGACQGIRCLILI